MGNPASLVPASNMAYDSSTNTLYYYDKATSGWLTLPESALRRKYVTENFTGTDSATGLIGKTSTSGGAVWATDDAGTTWGLLTGKGYQSAGANSTAYVDSGQNLVRVQVTLSAVPSANLGGPVLRRQDASNYFHAALRGTGAATHYSISKRTAGTLAVSVDTTTTPAAGDVIQFLDDGTTLSLVVNGTTIATLADASFKTATKQGLYGNFSGGGSGGRYDDFMVQAF